MRGSAIVTACTVMSDGVCMRAGPGMSAWVRADSVQNLQQPVAHALARRLRMHAACRSRRAGVKAGSWRGSRRGHGGVVAGVAAGLSPSLAPQAHRLARAGVGAGGRWGNVFWGEMHHECLGGLDFVDDANALRCAIRSAPV